MEFAYYRATLRDICIDLFQILQFSAYLQQLPVLYFPL